MEPGVAFAILLGIFLLVAVPIFAIVAFVRVSKLHDLIGKAPQQISRIYALEQRLERLESKLTELASAWKATPAASVPSPAPPTAAKPEEPREIAVVAAAPPRQAPPPPPAVTPSLPAQVVLPRSAHANFMAKAETLENAHVEALIAGRWLHYVGILAVLFAVAFFLKYAFENNWIGPRGRVGIGLLIGSALFPWSHQFLDRGYKYFSEGIAGLGAAILYLSLWAGWHYYQVFSQSTAFALMILVTIATAIVAVGRNTERIAVLALIGGAVTPQLVSTGENHEVVLFTYIAVLGAGMLGLARVRDWKSLPPVQLVATFVYFWGWYSEFYTDNQLAITAFFATVFFFLFAALPVVRSRREGTLSGLEVGIVLVNTLGYLVALREMLWPTHRWMLTLAVVALGAAHVAVERALPEKEGSDSRVVRTLFAGLALLFVTLAIPIRLDGKWITMAWGIEGAILVWSGLRIRILALRIAGFALFAVAAGRLALIPIPAGQFLLNARFAAFAVVVASFFAAYFFAKGSDVELEEAESVLFVALGIAANVYAIAALSLELWDLFGRMPSLGIDRALAQQLALSTLWLVYAMGLMVAGVRRKSAPVRWQALAILGVVIVKVFLFDLSSLDRFYRIVSFLLLGVALLLISFYYQKRLQARASGEHS
jgi:uncharacterized membrane protein